MKPLVVFLLTFVIFFPTFGQVPLDTTRSRGVSNAFVDDDEEIDSVNRIRITSPELPREIQRTLESNALYQGWQRGAVFKNKKGTEYTIELREADAVRVYRFDKSGRPLLDN